MSWLRQLPKRKRRGSRPRCVLMMEGSREEVASRLTRLVNLPDVIVSPSDRWTPYGKPVRKVDGSWDKTPTAEARFDKANGLVPRSIQRQLRDWWLVARGNTPNWDIASTCKIKGELGLLLIEAKAHGKELGERDKCGSCNPKNREQIGRAIAEANREFQSVTGKQWCLSRDHHYQLSNRFAWSWKLVSLSIPVVLLYLGFLNAYDMAGNGPLFSSKAEWEDTLKGYCQTVVDETCWGEWLDFAGVPFNALIRGIDQPFDPNDELVGT